MKESTNLLGSVLVLFNFFQKRINYQKTKLKKNIVEHFIAVTVMTKLTFIMFIEIVKLYIKINIITGLIVMGMLMLVHLSHRTIKETESRFNSHTLR